MCGFGRTRVKDSRPIDAGSTIRRRRQCGGCGHRFTTYERIESVVVAKRDGRVETFDVEKVRASLERALTDRPVPPRSLEDILARVQSLTESGRVTSETIGHVVLEGLRELDEVAYLRFASVYKEFQEAGDFRAEMAALED